MVKAKTYLQNELDQKISKKIITSFIWNKIIGIDEKVLAVIGSAGILLIGSSLLIMEDRIVYENHTTDNIKNKTISFFGFC